MRFLVVKNQVLAREAAHLVAIAQRDAVVHQVQLQPLQVQEDVAAHQKAIAQRDAIVAIRKI